MIKFLLSLTFLLLITTGCHEKDHSKGASEPSASNRAESEDKQNFPEQSNDQVAFLDHLFPAPENGYLSSGYYKRLEGKLHNLPVVMHLIKTRKYEGISDQPFDVVSGFYFYEKYQNPIALLQLRPEVKNDSEQNLILSEHAQAESQQKWVGVLTNDGIFKGQWEDRVTGKKLSFELSEHYPEGSTRFREYHLGQFKEFAPSQEDGPKASCDFSLLYPENYDSELGYSIIWKILPQITNDSITELNPHPAEALLAESSAYFQNLEQQISEWGIEGMDHFNTLSNSVKVVWNRNNRLGLQFFTYSYTGGAHGNYGSSFVNVDLNKGGEIIQLKDVFRPGFEKPLKLQLQLAARKTYGNPIHEVMTEPFHEDNLEPTENFLLTDKGILFNYVPYEIAAYAVGEVQLFLAYADMPSILLE